MILYNIKLKNTLTNSENIIKCEHNNSILESAEHQNIDLPYSCRIGSCSACLGRILEGSVNQDDQTFLTKDELQQGYILTCVAFPISDATIATHQEEHLYK